MPTPTSAKCDITPYYATIDLGSNSFHLLIATVTDGQIKVHLKRSRKVQLGRGVIRNGRISDQAFREGLQCLKEFKSHISQLPACLIRVCGTQALRQADNSEAFIQAANNVGFNVQIIDGIQEATWIYQGITHHLDPSMAATPLLTIDIGGGSTEFAWGQGTQIQGALSLPIGCVSWCELFFADGTISSSSWDKACQATIALLNEQHYLIDFSPCVVFASSGTANLLSTVCMANELCTGGISVNGLQALKEQALGFHHINDLPFKQLKDKRKDLLLPGLSIMLSIMEALTIEQISFSKHALREGIILDMHSENNKQSNLSE